MENSETFDSLLYAINSYCESLLPQKFSAEFIQAVAMIANRQIDILASDLIAFAKHGKRVQCDVADVKLAARRNVDLLRIIEEEANNLKKK